MSDLQVSLLIIGASSTRTTPSGQVWTPRHVSS